MMMMRLLRMMQVEQCEACHAASLLQCLSAGLLPSPHCLFSPRSAGKLRHGVPVHLRGLFFCPALVYSGEALNGLRSIHSCHDMRATKDSHG